MKSYFFIVFTVLAIGFGHAQSGRINVEQDQKIDQLLKIYESVLSSADYYQIQVGFGSLAKANRIMTAVEQDFPLLPSKIDFDSPTYRVRVGRFKTRMEAERKFKEVRAKFPDAMLLKPAKKKR